MEFINNCDNVRTISKYMSLPVLLDMLKKKSITFLKPDNWEDKNDVEVMNHYRDCLNDSKKEVLAVCFTTGPESVYHWNAFAKDGCGCRIEFNFERLKEKLEKKKGIKCGLVDYIKVPELNARQHHWEELPFLKRKPYECEGELRMVTIVNKSDKPFGVKFDMTCVNVISISPWLPKPIADTVKYYLKKIVKNPKVDIRQSTLLENQQWIGHYKRITK